MGDHAFVPGQLSIRQAVGRALHAHGGEGAARIEVKRSDDTLLRAFAPAALKPDGLTVQACTGRHRDGEAIGEPAHAAQRAEIVVERAIFLHQHHDVLHVLDGPGHAVGRDRQRPANGRREEAHTRGQTATEGKKVAASKLAHGQLRSGPSNLRVLPQARRPTWLARDGHSPIALRMTGSWRLPVRSPGAAVDRRGWAARWPASHRAEAHACSHGLARLEG